VRRGCADCHLVTAIDDVGRSAFNASCRQNVIAVITQLISRTHHEIQEAAYDSAAAAICRHAPARVARSD